MKRHLLMAMTNGSSQGKSTTLAALCEDHRARCPKAARTLIDADQSYTLDRMLGEHQAVTRLAVRATPEEIEATPALIEGLFDSIARAVADSEAPLVALDVGSNIEGPILDWARVSGWAEDLNDFSVDIIVPVRPQPKGIESGLAIFPTLAEVFPAARRTVVIVESEPWAIFDAERKQLEGIDGVNVVTLPPAGCDTWRRIEKARITPARAVEVGANKLAEMFATIDGGKPNALPVRRDMGKISRFVGAVHEQFAFIWE